MSSSPRASSPSLSSSPPSLTKSPPPSSSATPIPPQQSPPTVSISPAASTSAPPPPAVPTSVPPVSPPVSSQSPPPPSLTPPILAPTTKTNSPPPPLAPKPSSSTPLSPPSPSPPVNPVVASPPPSSPPSVNPVVASPPSSPPSVNPVVASPPLSSPPPSSPPPPVNQTISPSPPILSPPPPTPTSPPSPSRSKSSPPPAPNAPEASPPPPIRQSPLPSSPTLEPSPSPNVVQTPPPSTPVKHPPDVASPPSKNTPPVTKYTPPPTSNLSPGSQGNIGTPVSPPTPTISPNSFSTATSSGGFKTGTTVAVVLVVSFLLLGLIGLAVWCVRRKKRKASEFGGGIVIPAPLGSCSSLPSDTPRSKTTSEAPLIRIGSYGITFLSSSAEPNDLGNSRTWFTYEELLQATNGFSEQNLLGEGGFGSVYKGCLPDGREVAVKQLKIGGGQGEREFRAEVEIISRVHHRHLVSLVGYCISQNQRLLVYDYVPNNTLHYHLHGHGRPIMDWATRVKVAAGAARGIAYLHEDCHPRIIHRDIKSSNILLDNNFEAQVSDFGLAKLAQDSFTHITTRVMGTFGYLAPEYASSGKLTEKSDVYSFGVVILELITGWKPVDASLPSGEESLVEWARPLMNHALDNQDFGVLVDAKLEKNYVESEMFRMIEAAAACVRHSSERRPRMSQVVRALDGIADHVDLNNGIKPGQSKLFDTAQQNANMRMFQRMAFGSQDYSTDYSQYSWSGSRDQ